MNTQRIRATATPLIIVAGIILSGAGTGLAGDKINQGIDIGASMIVPRGVPTLTTPLTGAEPRQIQDGISGIYRSGRTGTVNENEARQLRQLEQSERNTYGHTGSGVAR